MRETPCVLMETAGEMDRSLLWLPIVYMYQYIPSYFTHSMFRPAAEACALIRSVEHRDEIHAK